ncbi:type I-B CRISPR-associated protein Cas7/Csh2 [Candidatus Gracilibacteria bacterium]|nr:type I-B CRISPR-associated protein Cas7/Csh2 [Candidatus Gracilibacteria bacterium]
MNNSEILFLYDAKISNPNGDMDNENKPRMDWDTETNLVSDVRLKRYIRDYLKNVHNKDIFISSEAKNAKERDSQIEKNGKKHTDLIDIRLFGAVYAVKGENTHLTGPIQFNWGYSLNKVELQESKTITSSFSSGEGVGKDYRVNYSFIAFSGSINGLIAEQTMLKDEDINLFDKAMIESIPLNKTRSKEGQTPRLYLRVELKDNKSFLKDLREYIFLPVDIKNNRKLREIKDIQLDINQLIDYLIKNDSKILKVHYWKDDNLFLIKDDSELNKLKNKINKL